MKDNVEINYIQIHKLVKLDNKEKTMKRKISALLG
ncbi:MAG: hypothetical protein RLZ17_1004, partial [Actinomycetota bacterium]